VCAGSKGSGKVPSDRYVLVEGRVVALCLTHSNFVKRAKISTLEALRRAFPEATGLRSLVTRRGSGNRRIFPARPEGRRRSEGRRWDDELRD